MFYRLFSVFFFFNQKTAYELRISDWSSDVCSSDLFGNDDVAGGVALLHHSLDAERGNLLLARAGNVESVDELVLDGLGDLAVGGLDRLGELLRRLLGEQCGLDEQQLLQVAVLPQIGGGVCDEDGARLGLQAEAAGGVAAGDGGQGGKAGM